MNEQAPWEKMGISTEELFTKEAIEYWKTESVKSLWDNLLHVFGPHLGGIRTLLYILNKRADLPSIAISETETADEYINRMYKHIDKITDSINLMSLRLEHEKNSSVHSKPAE